MIKISVGKLYKDRKNRTQDSVYYFIFRLQHGIIFEMWNLWKEIFNKNHHVRIVHRRFKNPSKEIKRNFNCASCGNSYTSLENLKTHIMTIDNPWRPKKLQMWILWKILHWIRNSEKTHQDRPWRQEKLQMWFLWKILHSIRKSEDTHQDSSWKTK